MGIHHVSKKNCAFLLHVNILTCDIGIANLSVRQFVRYVPVLDENGSTYCDSFFTTRLSNHSSFTSIKHLHEIPTGSPPAGALNTGGYKKFCGFLPVSIAYNFSHFAIYLPKLIKIHGI